MKKVIVSKCSFLTHGTNESILQYKVCINMLVSFADLILFDLDCEDMPFGLMRPNFNFSLSLSLFIIHGQFVLQVNAQTRQLPVLMSKSSICNSVGVSEVPLELELSCL